MVCFPASAALKTLGGHGLSPAEGVFNQMLFIIVVVIIIVISSVKIIFGNIIMRTRRA